MRGLRDHGEEVGLEAEDVVESDLRRQAQAAAEVWSDGAGEIWIGRPPARRGRRGARGSGARGTGRGTGARRRFETHACAKSAMTSGLDSSGSHFFPMVDAGELPRRARAEK